RGDALRVDPTQRRGERRPYAVHVSDDVGGQALARSLPRQGPRLVQCGELLPLLLEPDGARREGIEPRAEAVLGRVPRIRDIVDGAQPGARFDRGPSTLEPLGEALTQLRHLRLDPGDL